MIVGLSNGFHLGFNLVEVTLKSASQNMPEASLHPSVSYQYLPTELEKGRIAGPFPISPIPTSTLVTLGLFLKNTSLANASLL